MCMYLDHDNTGSFRHQLHLSTVKNNLGTTTQNNTTSPLPGASKAFFFPKQATATQKCLLSHWLVQRRVERHVLQHGLPLISVSLSIL
jgi:hypothetical protein